MTEKTRNGRGWAYVGTTLGGAVSLAANAAHSYVAPAGAPATWRPHTGAIAFAVFWPIALFVAIEMLARVRWRTGALWIAVRYVGLVPVAVVAAIVSYQHLSGLLGTYGENRLTVVIGPLAVDGLMVLSAAAVMSTSPRNTPDIGPDTAFSDVKADISEQASDIEPGEAEDEAPDIRPDDVPDKTPDTKRRRKQPARRRKTTAEKVADLADKNPDMTPLEMAKKLRVTDRTVRRYLPAQGTAPDAEIEHANGVDLTALTEGN
jgi:hypothetical protein